MTPEKYAEIVAGVAACLELCQNTSRLDSSVAAFIKNLKDELDWADADLIELQTRVIQTLVERSNGPAPSP